MNILSVKKITKKYIKKKSFFKNIFSKKKDKIEDESVLENISFDLKRGETLGIIGKNGAGKSTLLKIISGVSPQTEGSVKVNGTLNSILELGAGFDYELDGEANCFNYLSLNGKNTKEIKKVIKDIKEFSELGNYFYQPLRTYSSGMIIRLAFSCTTVFKPDILILDEAFAVGDQFFQVKSFKKIKELKKEGTSIIFVSHDKSRIMNLSDKVLYIEKGKQVKIGNPEETYNLYNKNISENTNSKNKLEDSLLEYGTGEATIVSSELLDESDNLISSCYVGQKVKIKTRIKVKKTKIEKIILGIQITDRFGQNIFGTNTWDTDKIIHKPVINSEYEFSIKLVLNLGKGIYTVSSALVGGNTHLDKNFCWRDKLLTFEIYHKKRDSSFVGMTYLEHSIEMRSLK